MKINNNELQFDPTDASVAQLAIELAQLELNGVGQLSATPKPIRKLARRLAQSKRDIRKVQRKLTVGIVFAMWGETERIKPRSKDNPIGEDSLAAKLAALEWLAEDSGLSYRIYAIDDGCPQGSGNVAEERRRELRQGNAIQVAWLRDAVPGAELPLSLLRSTDDSKKGGAIALGCLTAVQDGCDYVLYTDCDNSVHLGQIGTMLALAEEEQLDAVFGDRQAANSDFYWHPERRGLDEGRKIVAHISRLLIPFELPTTDGMSPMKLFTASACKQLIRDLVVFDFAFDFDIIISAVAKGLRCKSVPYTFFDSYEASAWHTIGTYSVWAHKLSGIAKSVEKNGYPISEPLREIVRRLSTGEAIAEVMSKPLPFSSAQLRYGALGDPTVWSDRDISDLAPKGLTLSCKLASSPVPTKRFLVTSCVGLSA